ncbi:hypothetical protein PybrP1_012030, partial [[Pythium] brassicae (nom. inval.)]
MRVRHPARRVCARRRGAERRA